MSTTLRFTRQVCRHAALQLRNRALLPAATTRPRLLSSVVSGYDDYESPLQELFDRMERDGPTTLGTTEFTPEKDKYLKCGVPESALRFTTTHYGRLLNAPFVHANEHRVALRVNTNKLPLNDVERDILKEIVGSRLNEDRGELRLTSDQFGSRIENKRHLVSMLDRIILSCQRLAKELEKQEAV